MSVLIYTDITEISTGQQKIQTEKQLFSFIYCMEADLVNDHKFAKVSSAKILCSILNNIIKVQIRQSLFHQLCFCSEFTKVCTHQSFPLYGIVDLANQLPPTNLAYQCFLTNLPY